jgi:hypothetical protein
MVALEKGMRWAGRCHSVTSGSDSICCSCRCAPDICTHSRVPLQHKSANPGFGNQKRRRKVHGVRTTSSGTRAVCALPLDQVLYPALNLLRIGMKVRKQLLCGLRYKLLMRKSPPHLHDADYGCIDLKRPINLDHLRATRRVKLSLI